MTYIVINKETMHNKEFTRIDRALAEYEKNNWDQLAYQKDTESPIHVILQKSSNRLDHARS